MLAHSRWFTLVAVFTVTALNAAKAQNRWRQITTTPSVVIFLDTTRLSAMTNSQNGERRVIMAWLRWDFTKPQKTDSGRTYVRLLMQDQVRCSPLLSTTDYSVSYDDKGNVVGQTWDARASSAYRPLVEPAPDTMGETVAQAVCRWFGYLISQ